MPITIRHDAIGGLTGAYAAGQASARRRGQKYAMDLLLQQQRHAQRLQEIGLRGGARGRAVAPPLGRWDDPLAEDPFQEGANPLLTERERRAALRGRARKYRLGKDIPAKWQPEFIPQAEIERNQELQDKLKLMEQQHRFMTQRAAATQEAIGERAAQSQEAAARRAAATQEAIGERAAQSQQDREYAEVLNDLEFGRRVLDPTVRRRIDTAWQSIQSDPDLDEVQREEAVQEFKKWERRQIMGGIRFPETTVEERQAQKEDAKTKAAQLVKDRQDLTTRLNTLQDKLWDLQGRADEEANPTVVEEITAEIARIKAELAPAEAPAAPPEAPAGSTVPATPPPVAPSEPPTPTGEQPRPINQFTTNSGGTLTLSLAPGQIGKSINLIQGENESDEAFAKRWGKYGWTATITPPGEQPRPTAPAMQHVASAPPPPAPTDLPQVRTDADYDELAEGREFIDPEGRRRRKPYRVKPGPTFFDLMVR